MNDAPISVLLESKDSDIYTVPSTATVFEAVQEMVNAHVGAVMVVERNRLVGIFTERDVLVRVVAARHDPATTPVSGVMTRDPVTVESSMTLHHVLELCGGREFRHLPVVDDDQIVGMVSFRDVVRWFARGTGVPV